MHEPSQVGAARRHAAGLSSQLGFDAVAAGRLAIVVTELGNNLVKHAREGRVLLRASGPGAPMHVEVIALDRGPGMHDVDRCMADGFSTAGTAGGGLGSVRRLSAQFGIFSQGGAATVVVARVAADSASSTASPEVLDQAGVGLAAPGESVSGDSWAGTRSEAGSCLVVADGLGHGVEAAAAADAAIDEFRRRPGAGPSEVLECIHNALRGTRGAAVAVVSCDAVQGQVTVCGAGNISGRLISGTEDRSLATQYGTAGLQIRRVQSTHHRWSAHAVLILHTDGIATRWTLADTPGLLRCSAVVIAAWILHMHMRGRDDATVVVLRRH